MKRTTSALIVLCLLPAAVAAQTLPCYRLESPPTIDGRLNDPQWKRIPRVTGFVQQGNYSSLQTFVRAAWDDEALYIAFECLTPDPGALEIGDTERDDAVGRGASVEIFLDTNRNRRTYYHIVSNPGAGVYDGKEIDKSWNADYDVKAAVGESSWSLEITIPFKSLGASVPEDKTKWGANLCRNISPSQRGHGRYTSWIDIKGGFHKPAQFGGLLFCRLSLEPDAVADAEMFLNRPYLNWLDGRLEAASRELNEVAGKMRKQLAASKNAGAYESKQAELDKQIAEERDTAVTGDTLEVRVEALRGIGGILAAQKKLWNDFRFFDLFGDP